MPPSPPRAPAVARILVSAALLLGVFPGRVGAGPAPWERNQVRLERRLLLARLGPGSIIESRELRGAPADAERALRQALSPEARDELEQRRAREVLNADDLVYASVEGADDASGPLRIRMEVRGSRGVVTEDAGAEPAVPADPLFELLPRALEGAASAAGPAAEPRARRAGLLLPFAFRAELTLRVVVPDGFRVAALPAGTAERFGPVRLRSEYSIESGGTAVARHVLECRDRRLAAADATALARRIHALRRDGGAAIRVDRTAATHLAEGRIAASMAELRAVAGRNPEDVVAAGQLAFGLLRMGFSAEAAAELRRALQLHPDSAWAYRLLGFVLEHDALGRFRGPGFDRAAALTAYATARRLDPANAPTRLRLADLLAHTAEGMAPVDQREAAVAEYEAVSRELGDRSQEAARLELLLGLDRFEQAEALALELPRDESRDPFLLAAVAARDGDAARALRASEALGPARIAALREAARLLVGRRRYRIAGQLARAAADADPGDPGAEEEARTVAALDRWEVTRDRGDGGERIVRRLLHAIATAPDPARDVGPLLALDRLPEALSEQVRRSLTAPYEGTRRSSAARGISPAVVADLLLSGLLLQREGDPATGERVRIRLGPGERAPALTVFLVRAGEEVRVLGTDETWPALVGEADRSAAAGDLVAAARWIQFLRDALGEPDREGSPAAVLAALDPGPVSDPGAFRRAALALRAFTDREARTVPALLEAREGAREPAARRALGFALAATYRAAGRWPELEGIATDLYRGDLDSRASVALRAVAMARIGGARALDATEGGALGVLGGDPEVLTSLAAAQLGAGDLAGSLATHRRVIESGMARPPVYNDAAWLELFREAPDAAALEWARLATAAEAPSHASLNTLAVVHGMLGNAREAREALLRSLDAAGSVPPTPADWLAHGLVAEACGLSDAARAAYARVTPEPADPSAPFILARRRLAALDAPRPAPPTPPPRRKDPPPPSPPPVERPRPDEPDPGEWPGRATPA